MTEQGSEQGPDWDELQKLVKEAVQARDSDSDEVSVRDAINRLRTSVTGRPTPRPPVSEVEDPLDVLRQAIEDKDEEALFSALYSMYSTLFGLPVRTSWKGEPPAREWLLPGWLPAGRVVLLAAHGGSAKSLLALQVAVAVASGEGPEEGRGHTSSPVLAGSGAQGPRLTKRAKPGRVVFVTWEDETDELHRRLTWLSKRRDGKSTLDAVANRLHVLDLSGKGPLWGSDNPREQDAELLPLGRQVEDYVRAVQPRLVVIDPVAAAYGANENARGPVRQWLSHLGSLAADTSTAILLVAHPPKGKDAAAYSGSTDWRNGVRALWTLQPEIVGGYKRGNSNDPAKGQALTLEKANYAKPGRRAWLEFYVEPGDDLEDSPKRLEWRECDGAVSAATAYHEWRGWSAPERKKKPQEKKQEKTGAT